MYMYISETAEVVKKYCCRSAFMIYQYELELVYEPWMK